MVVRIRGYALPHGEYMALYADGDRWTLDPVRDADLVAEGWLLPPLEMWKGPVWTSSSPARSSS
ncbi:MAG TPA: hypothetical protein VFX16_15440 [Pseudonocardiaceae bacterium]|nr:hypothetical protein [Pseudonocardiaceae bacterium]